MRKSIGSPQYDAFLAALREARLSAGLSQEELAKLLDATQSFVSKSERGERRIDILELHQWCRALGISFTRFCEAYDRSIRGRGGRG
jgi:transcriptional regulator with XRE-family HTH domain